MFVNDTSKLCASAFTALILVLEALNNWAKSLTGLGSEINAAVVFVRLFSL